MTDVVHFAEAVWALRYVLLAVAALVLLGLWLDARGRAAAAQAEADDYLAKLVLAHAAAATTPPTDHDTHWGAA